MTKSKIAIAAAIALGVALPAAAQDFAVLRANRLGAPDKAGVEAQAKFYHDVLGLQVTGRLERPNTDPDFLEIFMKPGATPEEARQSTSPTLLLITTPKGSERFKDPVAHLMFSVKDAAAVVAKVIPAGGTVQKPAGPSANGNTAIFAVAFVLDPVGNRIELVQSKP